MADDTDERTEELGDLFEEVTDATTVTEEQREGRGTLRDADEVREDLLALVEEAVDDLDVTSSLGGEALADVVEGYFEGEDDATIAEAVDAGQKTVRRARVQLHLLRDADRDAPLDLDALRDRLASQDDASAAALADDFDVSEGTLRFYARVVEAEHRAARAGDYRDRFASVLQAEVSDDLTSSAQNDGLAEATDDMEVDVDL